MQPDLDRIVESLFLELRRSADPARREFVKGYAPTAEGILGVSVPITRRAARRARAGVSDQPLAVRIGLAKRIIDLGFLETRQAAYELLQDDAPRLSKTQLVQLGRGIDNWGTVDAFSCLLAGPAWLAGRLQDEDVRRWARSRDPWWRRVAVVSTVVLNTPSRGGTGDAARTIEICRLVVDDENRFVRKALSWALRALSRWDADAVRRFLREQENRIPRFVLREVTTKLTTGRKGGHPGA
jgi:3-methyladenine DNA glycosylase AlkD